MFPLGAVLLPASQLPLQIFEARYTAMLADVLDGHREFGVVMITRGSEVGGGDQRSDIGTIAQIIEAEQEAEDRWRIIAAGTRRFDVVQWLPDDPYPNAVVRDRSEDTTIQSETALAVADVAENLQRLLLAARTNGYPVEALDAQIAEDAALGSFQLAGLAPFGSYDRQRVLQIDDPQERLSTVNELIDQMYKTIIAEAEIR
jgi:Lon protease-like protein